PAEGRGGQAAGDARAGAALRRAGPGRGRRRKGRAVRVDRQPRRRRALHSPDQLLPAGAAQPLRPDPGPAGRARGGRAGARRVQRRERDRAGDGRGRGAGGMTSPAKADGTAPGGGLAARLPAGVRERLTETVSQVAAGGALIVVFIYLSFASPEFLTSDNLFNVGAQTAVTAII